MQNGDGILVTDNQDVECEIIIELFDPGHADIGNVVLFEVEVL